MSSKPTLYYLPGSPPVRTVLLVASALNIDLDLKLVDMGIGEHMSPEYLKMNPQHTVPTMMDEGRPLYDSHAIATYLIRKFGGDDHPLYPNDVYTRARIDQRLHFDTSILFGALREIFLPIYFDGAYDVNERGLKAAHDAYGFMETFLSDERFLTGDTLTLADYSCITSVTHADTTVPIDAEKYPRLTAWMQRCQQDMDKFEDINTKPMNEFIMGAMATLRADNRAAAEAKAKEAQS